MVEGSLAEARELLLFEQREDLFGVAFGFDFFEDVNEALVGTNEIGGALYAFD